MIHIIRINCRSKLQQFASAIDTYESSSTAFLGTGRFQRCIQRQLGTAHCRCLWIPPTNVGASARRGFQEEKLGWIRNSLAHNELLSNFDDIKLISKLYLNLCLSLTYLHYGPIKALHQTTLFKFCFKFKVPRCPYGVQVLQSHVLCHSKEHGYAFLKLRTSPDNNMQDACR